MQEHVCAHTTSYPTSNFSPNVTAKKIKYSKNPPTQPDTEDERGWYREEA